jgi:hypothetical protein
MQRAFYDGRFQFMIDVGNLLFARVCQQRGILPKSARLTGCNKHAGGGCRDEFTWRQMKTLLGADIDRNRKISPHSQTCHKSFRGIHAPWWSRP